MLTFSHADEARKAMLLTSGEMFIDQNLVRVTPKGKLDHSEIDRTYFMRKMLNESKLVEEKADLRTARQKLRDFETNIENELPSLQRLQQFKSIAQEMVENPRGKTRRNMSLRRNKREREELF